ncbi:DNA-methyltransferase [Ensifer sp. SL37]|uniref:DNA-methyltransferase n=1 Tax=Ensifer sp. SL37 TaxID=2995137 RepID=UPI002276008B|nr:site-specific DNA-methyltransferase [Ensifer sp. SL37]MCY1741202.1 site-specific DNA-methyltransferase [Ensifer sp. SL37]
MSVQILNADFDDAITDMPSESVDCILTDPPYGETSLEWDKWPPGWPSRVLRLLKPTGSMWVFGSTRTFFDHAAEFTGWQLAQDVVWEKHNGSGFQADRFKRVHENALQFYRADSPWEGVYKDPQYTPDAVARAVRRKKGRPAHMGNIEASPYFSEEGGPRLMRSVIFCRSEHGRAVHPTQKPLGVVEPLLLYSCPKGGTVLDIFAGSGTTGVAAQRHGREAILIEGKPEFVEAVRIRLENDAPLFGGQAA